MVVSPLRLSRERLSWGQSGAAVSICRPCSIWFVRKLYTGSALLLLSSAAASAGSSSGS
jgi:hypothetical protein